MSAGNRRLSFLTMVGILVTAIFLPAMANSASAQTAKGGQRGLQAQDLREKCKRSPITRDCVFGPRVGGKSAGSRATKPNEIARPKSPRKNTKKVTREKKTTQYVANDVTPEKGCTFWEDEQGDMHCGIKSSGECAKIDGEDGCFVKLECDRIVDNRCIQRSVKCDSVEDDNRCIDVTKK